MSVFTFPVTQRQRLDILLTAQDGVRSRVHAKKLIQDGCVQVDGVVRRHSSFFPPIDSMIRVQMLPTEQRKINTVSIQEPLRILYEDDYLFVIDKPSGIAVHPGHSMSAADATMLDLLCPLFAQRSLAFLPSHTLVHRLDKDTTGCLLVAKNAVSHLALQRLFRVRDIQKCYLALCAGIPSPRTAIIDAPIGRHLTERTHMSVTKVGSSRIAKTLYRTVAVGERTSLLSCDLLTGRTHQIRVHLSSVGHPLLGDATYGNAVSLSLSSAFHIKRICLHAWSLDFISPFTQETIHVEAMLPPDFQTAASRAGIVVPSLLS